MSAYLVSNIILAGPLHLHLINVSVVRFLPIDIISLAKYVLGHLIGSVSTLVSQVRWIHKAHYYAVTSNSIFTNFTGFTGCHCFLLRGSNITQANVSLLLNSPLKCEGVNQPTVQLCPKFPINKIFKPNPLPILLCQKSSAIAKRQLLPHDAHWGCLQWHF